MPAKRPTSVLVIAILHFVFGGLGLIIGLVGVGFAAYALAQPPTPPGYKVTTYPPDVMDTMRYMDANVPGYRLFQLPSATLGLVLSGALLSAGMGLVKMKPWGRRLSIFYGFASIFFQIAVMVYVVACVTPAQMAMYDNMPMQPGMASMTKTILGCSQFAGLIGLVYPIVVLVIMLLPSVKRAFSGAAEGAADQAGPGTLPEDYGSPPPGYGGEPDDRFGSGPG